jgi:hypothetical protein
MADKGAFSLGVLEYSPGNPQFPVLPTGPLQGTVDNFYSAASLTFEKGVVVTLAERSATKKDLFADWYLGTTWVSPVPVDFGNITATKTRQVILHNTRRASVQLTAIDVSAIPGLTVISAAPPITIPSYSSITVTFEITTTGDAAFDENVLFTVDGGDIAVRFIGRRLIIYNTLPQKPIKETIAFITDRMVSINGIEQVMELRQLPRSTIRIVERFEDNVRRSSQLNVINAAGFLRVGIQLWYEAREIDVAAAAIDTVVQMSTDDGEFAVGQEMSFVTPAGVPTNAISVLSFTPTAVTLESAVGIVLPLGTVGMPIKYGFLRPKGTIHTWPINAEDITLDFTIIEYRDIAALNLAYFDTHPLEPLAPVLIQPLFMSGRNRTGLIEQNLDVLDSRTGDIASRRQEALARPGMDVLVHLNTLADQHAWRQWIYYVRGSWRPFYIPSGTNDLPLGVDFTLGGNTFSIINQGLEEVDTAVSPRRDLKLTIEGVDYIRRITSVADAGPNEVVTIDSVIPGAGTVPADEVKISWLYQVRMEGDTATFNHLRTGVAELRFRVQGVIAL